MQVLAFLAFGCMTFLFGFVISTLYACDIRKVGENMQAFAFLAFGLVSFLFGFLVGKWV